MRAGLWGRVSRVAAAFRVVTVTPMPARRGVAPLADVPDRQRRDGPPELVIRGKHPMVAPGWRRACHLRPVAVTKAVTKLVTTTRPVSKNLVFSECERGESNPHTFWVLEPKSSASANSATLAWPLSRWAYQGVSESTLSNRLAWAVRLLFLKKAIEITRATAAGRPAGQ